MSRFFDVVKGREDFPSNREIYGRYMKLAWPAAVEGMFSILISAINLIIIGALGTNSVAAVGIIGQAGMIIQTIARALSVAGTAMIARKYGEEKYDEANDALRYILVFAAVSTLVLCALSYIFIVPILNVSGAKEEYLTEAVVYGRSFIVSLMFLNITTVLNSGLIAAGRTRQMMISNIAGSILIWDLHMCLPTMCSVYLPSGY